MKEKDPIPNYRLTNTCASCLHHIPDFSRNTAYDTHHCKLLVDNGQEDVTVNGHFVCDKHIQDGYCLE